jgi:hypothetical protein
LAAGKEFIAEDPVHVVVASESPAIYDHHGRMIEPKRRRLFAKFQRGQAPVYAQKVALSTFGFRKIHEGISRERWFGYYDSKAAQKQNDWTPDEHDRIVARLTELGYLEVQPEKAAAPWPAYDKLTVQGQRTVDKVAEKIVAKITEDGYDPAEVLAYEQQNANRDAVVAAVAALLPSVEDGEPEPLVAA